MTQHLPDLTVRPARQNDISELRALLNEIVELGGTTAIETPLTDEMFKAYFLHGDAHICCNVAVTRSGNLAGFQAVERHPNLPDDWADIATFARLAPKTPGVGTAMFAVTQAFAKNEGVIAINATIRADNSGGLAYYDKMGFETYAVDKNVPLLNGTPIDRISKRLFLRA